jgi:hypothetical protein
MLLADSAQVADGKLFILGGGWSVVGPDPRPRRWRSKWCGLPRVQHPHHWELFLEDADGQQVRFETPEGSADH